MPIHCGGCVQSDPTNRLQCQGFTPSLTETEAAEIGLSLTRVSAAHLEANDLLNRLYTLRAMLSDAGNKLGHLAQRFGVTS
jgi:hypothetical protein